MNFISLLLSPKHRYLPLHPQPTFVSNQKKILHRSNRSAPSSSPKCPVDFTLSLLKPIPQIPNHQLENNSKAINLKPRNRRIWERVPSHPSRSPSSSASFSLITAAQKPASFSELKPPYSSLRLRFKRAC